MQLFLGNPWFTPFVLKMSNDLNITGLEVFACSGM